MLRNEVNEAPTKLNNVASEHPVRLAQMKALFDKEARANNVHPLINRSDLSVGITDYQRKARLLPPAPAASPLGLECRARHDTGLDPAPGRND